MSGSSVSIWEESIVIPTYPVYPPEKSPLFIEKRAYQGSTGKVYPLPVTEKISDVKEDVSYHAVFLENEYLKIMVLPELGGRIQRAYDKTNDYDFVYYNHVIKPALVGLTGPWISGGIEFNWPQHHRPSTYSPVDYTISQNEDGSATVYVSETDKMYGTKGMAAISLYPGKAYIEIKGQLYNHTDFAQTFLWWANPAVPVNDHTYSVFPPDVNAVMDHGKRAVSTFPIATGEYYKMDYSAGVDISRYKNVPVPTSYMAAHSDFDFIGNYDENIEAGLLHVADHHFSPGKKQWTWGNGDFGRMWDKNLTETDGPYIELMTGVYTDNQPDFTWLKPQEEKTFLQYFMPYKGVGRVGNATKDAMISISEADDRLLLKVYTTGKYENAQITVSEKDYTLFKTTAVLSPETCFTAELPKPTVLADIKASVTCKGCRLVEYSVFEKKPEPIPEPADALPAPVDMKSLEDLYLAGTHLEQYRHATYEPADYYLEGLRRDPTDIRLNDSYGLLLFKRGHIKESIPYFEAAVRKQTRRNPNPYMGECYYHLGLALEMTGEDEKAFDAFFKATWSAETQGCAFYWLARLSARRGQFEEALGFVEKSLLFGWHNMRARTLKAALLRKLHREHRVFIKECLDIDPLYMGCLFEQAQADKDFTFWKEKMRKEAHNYLELALDYLKDGFYEDALLILKACPDTNPLVPYYQGYIYLKLDQKQEAATAFEKGEAASPDYCFPSRVEELLILTAAINTLDTAPMAHYYLGNLLYDKKQYEAAVVHWEAAVKEKSDIAMAWRNISIAYYNKQRNPLKAMEAMETACRLDATYSRFWLEYDQLAAKLNTSASDRLTVMEQHPKQVQSRDALYLRYVTMLNCVGRYADALAALKSFHFHPWEGGEGKVSAQYRFALIQLAKQALEANDAAAALSLLTETLTYPDNLGEGKLPNVPDNEAHYYMGLAYRMMNDSENAKKYLQLATTGAQEPGSVLYYNDQPSDFIFYQGLAQKKLGNENAAKKAFHQLIAYGERHIFDQVSYDYFAVSLPEIEVYQDDIALRNIQYCRYLQALGYLGLGKTDKAASLLQQILEKQKDHQGAICHLQMINE